MSKMRFVVGMAFTLIALATSGCALFLVGAGVVVGAGTVAYVSGELRGAEEVPMLRAWTASQRAMQELEFKVTKAEKDALAGEIVARRADGTRIVIRVRRQSDQVTELRIRVGTFGEESLSRLIYDKIKKNL